MKKGVDLSIVIPVFNEEENLLRLYPRLKSVLERLRNSYEIIFVDDGSADASFEVLRKLYHQDKKIKVIRFRKNFSKTPALMAGFELARGKIILTMDSDLQNDPLDIHRFVDKIEEGYDVVVGWRYKRKDPLSKLIPSKFYNWLAQKLTKLNLHDLNCGFKAFRKESLIDINLFGEMHRYLPVFLAARGYRTTEIKVIHHERKFGKSKYGFVRILKGFLDLLYVKFWLDYSTRPIHFLGSVGILQYFLALLIFVEQIIKAYTIKMLNLGPVLMLGVMFVVTGTLCILFGFLAEIQIRTFYAKSNDKTYAIKEVLK